MVAPIEVLVAEDHPLYRHALAQFISAMPEVIQVHQASNGRQALALVQCHQPAVVIADLEMPELDGYCLLDELQRLHPQVKVLVLSMHTDEATVRASLGKGASGYLAKDAEPEQVLLAIRTVLQGQAYLTPQMASTLALYHRHTQPEHDLTDRELEVVRLLCQGQTTAQMAEALCMSIRTVERLRSSILEKSGAQNTAGVVLFATKHKLLKADA